MGERKENSISSVITATIERGKKYPFYFFGLPAILVAIEILSGFALWPFLPNASAFNPGDAPGMVLSRSIRAQILMLPIWLVAFPILGLIQARIAVQSGLDQPEAPSRSVIEGARRYPRLILKGILLFVVMLPALILVFVAAAAILGIVAFAITKLTGSAAGSAVFIGISFVIFYAILFLGGGPLFMGVLNLLIIRVITKEEKEIRTAFSFARRHLSFIYPLHLAAMLLFLFIMVLSYVPIMGDYLGWLASAMTAQRGGVSMESAATMQNLAHIMYSPKFFLSVGMAGLINYYLGYLVLAFTAHFYVANPPLSDPAVGQR